MASTISRLDGPRESPVPLLGDQSPRVRSVPDYVSSSGVEAVELAAMAGLVLDPWQQLVLTDSLGETSEGRWAAFEVGVVVARQNGKGGLLEARELAGLFLLGERLIIHSAHQFDTSIEAFRRLLGLIEDTPELSRRVRRVVRSHGEEGIELVSGQRIRFRTRTKGGGRGFTCDCLILDEAMILPKAAHGALLPTLAARPDPQVWYTGSAVDQKVHEHGVVLARIRERGLGGTDPRLAYFEWSADETAARRPGGAVDRRLWAAANPGLGIRISEEHVASEQRSMDPETFLAERLSVGDWPSSDEQSDRVIPDDVWAACGDTKSVIVGRVVFGVDVAPDRSRAAVCAAGRRADGLISVEVVEAAAGTGWVADRVADVSGRAEGSLVVFDARSAAASLAADIRDRGVVPVEVGTADLVRACGMFFDSVSKGSLRFPAPQPELTLALQSARVRPVGDAWAWARARRSGTDISPLVAATLAAGRVSELDDRPPRVWSIREELERLKAERSADG